MTKVRLTDAYSQYYHLIPAPTQSIISRLSHASTPKSLIEQLSRLLPSTLLIPIYWISASGLSRMIPAIGLLCKNG